jgi:putative polyhydroxyalkanoate system protein
MPKLTIEKSHQLEHQIVRQRLIELQTRLAGKYGIDARWTSDTEATIKRTGASGTIRCEKNRVVVDLDLNFVLTPLKGKIENRVREELDRVLT